MDTSAVLAEAFGRIGGLVDSVLEGLEPEDLSARLGPDANSIGWLVWHLTRIQDDHIADAVGHEQVWTAQGWSKRFALPFDDSATGYGQSAAEVAQVRPESAELLAGYYADVAAQTLAFVAGLTGDDLDRVVDSSWDPPVTLGVRLVSILGDDLQHAGQAAYVKGLLDR